MVGVMSSSTCETMRPQERYGFDIVVSVVGFHSLSRERIVYSSPSPRKGQLTINDGVGQWNPKEPGWTYGLAEPPR
jgi:hypothetical protein